MLVIYYCIIPFLGYIIDFMQQMHVVKFDTSLKEVLNHPSILMRIPEWTIVMVELKATW